MAYISYDFYINQLKVEESKNLTKIENNKPVYNLVYIYIYIYIYKVPERRYIYGWNNSAMKSWPIKNYLIISFNLLHPLFLMRFYCEKVVKRDDWGLLYLRE